MVFSRPAITYILRLWVLFIGAMILLAPTDIPLGTRAIAAVSLAIFFFGAFIRNRDDDVLIAIPAWHINQGVAWLLLLIQVVLVNFSMNFYANSNIVEATLDTLSGANRYSLYQSYFSETGIADMSVFSRLSAILCLTASKIIFLFNLICFFFNNDRRNWYDYVLLLLSTFFYISFGLSRGTFLEVFEVLCAYAYLKTAISSGSRSRITVKQSVYAIIVSVVVILLFVLNGMRRYESSDLYLSATCSSNFCFRAYGVIETVEYIWYVLAIYFANGIYTLSVLIENTFNGNEYLYLVPLHSMFFEEYTKDLGVRGMMCDFYVTCDFVWTPDILWTISIFGFLSVVVMFGILWNLGLIERSLFRTGNPFGFVTAYFLFLAVMSQPVSNFYSISSSNILGSIISTFIYFAVGDTHRRALAADARLARYKKSFRPFSIR